MPRVPCGASGQPGEDEVDDIVGEVVLAKVMKIFWPRDPVAAVAGRLGAGLERADVRARLRLGQVHRPGPFAADQLRQPGLLADRRRAVMAQRLDRAGRQHHAPARSPCSPSRDPPSPPSARRQRQALAAIFGRAGERAPAALDIGAIGLPEPRRQGHALGRPFARRPRRRSGSAARTRPRRTRRRRRRSRRPGRASPRRRRCRLPARRSRRCGGAGTSVRRREACRSWEVGQKLRCGNGRYSARRSWRKRKVLPYGAEAIAEAARLIAGGPAGRDADRDGLRPRRRRDQRRGGRAHLRGQGPAELQSADRPCPRPRPGRDDRRCSTTQARALAERHWPGPLTLVLPLRDGSPDRVAGHRRPADRRDPRPGPSGDARPARRFAAGRSPRRRPMPAAGSARPAPSMSSPASAAASP